MNIPETPTPEPFERARTGLGKDALKRAFLDNLFYIQGKFPALATKKDYYMALAYMVRDRLLQRWVSTATKYTEEKSRTVAYLSAEFLMGPHLGNNLINLGIFDQVKEAIEELGLDLETLLRQEEEPGLGNGGLGRLAACFLDSLAALELPALGYGIRYEFGIFKQEIVNGWQVEKNRQMVALWQPLGNPTPRVGCGCDVGRTHRKIPRRIRTPANTLGSRKNCQRCALRHTHYGLSQQHSQHLALVVCRSPRIIRFCGLQSRRLLWCC
jgi:hypothetical protein